MQIGKQLKQIEMLAAHQATPPAQCNFHFVIFLIIIIKYLFGFNTHFYGIWKTCVLHHVELWIEKKKMEKCEKEKHKTKIFPST